ncbi:hypothetical protein A2U01_0109682, partial [Trifolium medium]|nr:hypothetical protein [Trifolium medium]
MTRPPTAPPEDHVDDLTQQLAFVTSRLDEISLRMGERQSSVSSATSVPAPEPPHRHRLK